MDTKEKSAPLREPTDADYIMFNHDVLRACWDLKVLSKLNFYLKDSNDNDFNNAKNTLIEKIQKIHLISENYTMDDSWELDKQDALYLYNDICEGTQLLNSFEGMLILPFQKILNNGLDKKDYSFDDYYLPTLYSFLDDTNYKNSYFNLDPSRGNIGKEKNFDPMIIIKHLRNSMAHDRLGLMPINVGMEIKKIKFTDKKDWLLYKDKNKNSNIEKIMNESDGKYEKYLFKNQNIYRNYFELTIDFNQLDIILEEISNFLNDVLEGKVNET